MSDGIDGLDLVKREDCRKYAELSLYIVSHRSEVNDVISQSTLKLYELYRWL